MEDGGDDGGEEATKVFPDRLQSIAFIFASASDDQIPTVGTDPSKKGNKYVREDKERGVTQHDAAVK
ncbi:hypothetical protein AnigIFM56816_005414 [Aspergillus niger]|nr:hypothetical protein AnigIFM56816_005414 [Aspergillus niger]